MTEQIMRQMHMLANGYAKEKIHTLLDEIEAQLKSSTGSHAWSRRRVEKAIGQYLALSYAKGYADCAEHVSPKTLVL